MTLGNHDNRTTVLKYAATLFIAAILVTTGCRTKDRITPAITGCMDNTALNYNAAATISGTCTYANSHLAGTYLVSDTLVSFQHDMTTGWYDTQVSNIQINATVLGKDTVKFDTIILCGGLLSGCTANGGIRIQGNSGFYFNNYDPYNAFIGTGTFTADTLTYKVGTGNMSYTGSYYHKGRGVKQ